MDELNNKELPEQSLISEEKPKKSKTAHLAPWQFKKGQSGNPKGRTPGPSLKERAQRMLESMTDEEAQEFLHGMDKKIIWEMAEGGAKQTAEIKGKLTISKILDSMEQDGQTPIEQGVENAESLQNQEQTESTGEISEESGTGALQPEQAHEEPNPQV